MADSMEPCKVLWADPCWHGNEFWARREDPVAYRLVCSFVSSFVPDARRDFSKSRSPMSIKFGTDVQLLGYLCQVSLLTFQR